MQIKKVVLCLLALMVAGQWTVSAQIGEVENYKQGKGLAKTFEPQFIGSDGQVAVFVQMAGRMKNKAELVSYDMEQKELARVRLSENDDLRSYGGYVNGNYADLLMAEWKGEDMKVYRDRRDKTTLQPVGEPLVLSEYKGTKGDKMAFTIQPSANEELLAGIYIIGREGQPVEMQVSLYSRELEEYWKMDTRCRKLDFVYVTDSGEVLIGGYNNPGKFLVYVLDGENEESYTFEEEFGKISEARIARYAKGKIYIVLAHSGREKNEIHPMVDYIASLCYDTKRKEASVDKHVITQMEYNRLNNNVKDDAKVKNVMSNKKDDYRVPFFSLNQVIPDKDCCYAMFDQSWRVTLDGRPSEWNRYGMMVARVDNDGKFEWINTCHFYGCSAWDSRSFSGYRWVRTDKGLLLVWAENKTNIKNKGEEQMRAYTPMNSAGMLTAALLDGDGSMVRQHFEMPSKQSLMGYPHKMDNGDYLLFIRGKSQGFFAKLKLK